MIKYKDILLKQLTSHFDMFNNRRDKAQRCGDEEDEKYCGAYMDGLDVAISIVKELSK